MDLDMSLKVDDICTVKVAVPGNWPAWYLARIIAFEDDNIGNWNVLKFRVVGEAFIRDSYDSCYVIHDEAKQVKAQKLAKTLWTPKAFKELDEVRAAINEVW
jgi:hypothetical protein